jgi:hypothetical protein
VWIPSSLYYAISIEPLLQLFSSDEQVKECDELHAEQCCSKVFQSLKITRALVYTQDMKKKGHFLFSSTF